MGYTHYWNGKIENWKKTSRDIVRLLESSPVPLANWDGKDSPEVSARGIMFNGIRDEMHESFSLSDGDCNDFCKTARKPYDVIVTAVLIIAGCHNWETFHVSSDGNCADWKEGLKLAKKIVPDVVIPFL